MAHSHLWKRLAGLTPDFKPPAGMGGLDYDGPRPEVAHMIHHLDKGEGVSARDLSRALRVTAAQRDEAVIEMLEAEAVEVFKVGRVVRVKLAPSAV